MPRKPDAPDQWPGFEIAIEGEGLSPAELPVRVLVDLLEAAAKIVEEVAAQRGTKLPPPSLIAVRTGSAAYELRIRDRSAFPVVAEIQRQIQTRGQRSGPEIRQAIKRLHDAGGRVGSVRFTAYPQSGAKPKPLYVAPPVESVPTPFDATDEVQGRVVGVMAGATKLSVRIRLDDGRTLDFRAEDEVARRGARLFLKPVRVQVDYQVSDDDSAPGAITAIEQREDTDEDFLVEVDGLREELLKGAAPIRASDWLREIEEDR